MSEGYKPKPTQEQRILDVMQEADGWVDGMTFLRMVPAITQYHARIFGLQEKGYVIEGRYIEGKNWKEYRLIGATPPPIPVSPEIITDRRAEDALETLSLF